MKLQKSYGCGFIHEICGYQLHRFLQIVFLETLVGLLSGNRALTCIKKFHVFGKLTLVLFVSLINNQIDHLFPLFSLFGKVAAKI